MPGCTTTPGKRRVARDWRHAEKIAKRNARSQLSREVKMFQSISSPQLYDSNPVVAVGSSHLPTVGYRDKDRLTPRG